MIKVVRTNKPEILAQHADQWKADYLTARAALDAAPSPEEKKQAKKVKDAIEKKYNHPQIREALETMFNNGKCAYCESLITHVGYSQIEHFRPKNSFPELCFEWDNLLLACSVCNGAAYKGTKFPRASDGGFLVNPCEDDPDDLFDFSCELDENSEEGFIAVVRPKHPRGEITEQSLGLNRIPLLRKRIQALVPYYLALAEKAKGGDPKAKALLEKASHPRFEYSAFAKSLLRQLAKD